MKPPDAQSVHIGHGLPDWPRLKRIQEWLKENGIDPRLVAVNRPVYVLPVPNGTIEGGVPWLIDVIIFHEYYENPDGHREQNFITNEAVMFQRTVPLQVPFPADPATADEGTSHGEADRQAAQKAPEVQVRPSRSTPVPDRHKGQISQRPGSGSSERIEGDSEDHPSQGDQAVPEPEEDRQRPEEAVTEPKGKA